MDRRRFLKRAGLASAALAGAPTLMQLLESCGGGTASQEVTGSFNVLKGGQLTYLAGQSFVPAADKKMGDLINSWASQHKGWSVQYQTLGTVAMDTKVPAVFAAKSGPDLIGLGFNQAWEYAASCVDVGSAVKAIEKHNGPFYQAMVDTNKVHGVWRAVPLSEVGVAWIYRTDLWSKVGKPNFVSTYADMLKYGTQLVKETNIPMGFTLGHASGDASNTWYPVLWGFGAKEVEKDGTTVALDSKETQQAVEWAIEMWNSGAESHDTLSWTDSDNNLAWASHSISATGNGDSIYINSLPGGSQADPFLAKNSTAQAVIEGPAKVKSSNPSTGSIAVTKWSKNPGAAMELIQYLMQRKNFEQWMEAGGGYNSYPGGFMDDSPVWKQNPVLKQFNDSVKFGRWVGWPGPPSRAASLVETRFYIVDMFHQAVLNPKNAKSIIKTTAQQLDTVYGTAGG